MFIIEIDNIVKDQYIKIVKIRMMIKMTAIMMMIVIMMIMVMIICKLYLRQQDNLKVEQMYGFHLCEVKDQSEIHCFRYTNLNYMTKNFQFYTKLIILFYILEYVQELLTV
jgi:hypothetical protein